MPMLLNTPASSLLTARGASAPAEHKPRAASHGATQAGLAELTLVNRLRARTRRDLAVDALERAAHIIEVTAGHWFAPQRALSRGV